ncbi:LuxR C-terminal-related transcriptional regulator [Clostridium autoethanogenum]|uniref:LuxR C-terminal-related transcriptional regulator n=1 Tax=Clostridium autoethanogenum DSM 10061 TaxID=1341692 RepID=A0ABM5NQQ3_9CLOT|nr:LuxR C-terminal-related transcriptional regulator [Clostridium autoethanogenum]AGY74623.1 LuxR C-terminal-related transcriptional regulator [Clostridium autoethanogenum DSM 10061]ALU34807.1 ATP-dependent transcriptional regulator MalT-like LuxR family [Clostridium autoethanogenum DSM 10061]OVY51526.1 HTH-type transcriptional regulator MalT [Clostridium autoethanogenum]
MKKIKLLKRQRINHILSVIYHYPLTIVEAPMGFGKTTAVRHFLESKKSPYFWITFLNSNENTSFLWSDFSNEISKIDEDAGQKLKSLGFPVDVPQMSKVLSILNHIDYDEKTVFVIDDYHLSKKTQVNKLLRQIVLERLDNFHIVIITRDTTEINFTELFSKGLCQVISQQQLKFTYEEIENYCLMMNKNISSSDLEKIEEYTDGWISLTYMVILGLEKGIPVGMNNTIEDLVENTLFDAYDGYIQNFLLELSIMDSFTAKQAFFVTHEERTDKILKKLRQENAFVFYDEVNKTYKIHNVLLDFLRIKQHFKPAHIKELYRRLGYWYLSKKDFIIGYGYLNRAGDVEKILSDFNNPHNVRNELTEFEGSFEMFNSLPEELLYKYPVAYLQHIFLSILKGNDEIVEDCAQRLDRLQQFYSEIEVINDNYRNHIIAEILIVKKFTVFNHAEEMIVNNHKIIELLNGKQSYIMLRENEYTFGSPHLIYIYFREQGTLKEILYTITKKFSLHAKIANGCGTGCEYVGLAEYALETGDFKSVELNSFKAIYKAKTKEQTSLIICANFNLMRLYAFQGKIDESIRILNNLEEEVNELNNPIYNTTMDLCRGYIYGCIGYPEKIPYWLQVGDMTDGDFFYQGMAFNYIVYGKAVMLTKNYVKLEMLTESFEEYFSIFSNQLGFIHNSIFKAVAKYNLYGMEKGVSELQEALSKARQDYIIAPFVENALYIISMLETILNNNSRDEYINKTTVLSRQYIENLQNSSENKINLSQRELEVLSLTAKGLKRTQVACKLGISESTAKTHLQNIYKKLQVSGKFEAVKIARMYGII